MKNIYSHMCAAAIPGCLLAIQLRYPGSGEAIVSSDHIVSVLSSDTRCGHGPSIILDKKSGEYLCPTDGYQQIKASLQRCMQVQKVTQ
jgi:hypothetical protein